MKLAHTRQRMTNNNNNNLKKKFDTSEYHVLISYATTVTLKFEIK